MIAQKFEERACEEILSMLNLEWGNFEIFEILGGKKESNWKESIMNGVPFHLLNLKPFPVEFCARGVEFGVLYIGVVSGSICSSTRPHHWMDIRGMLHSSVCMFAAKAEASHVGMEIPLDVIISGGAISQNVGITAVVCVRPEGTAISVGRRSVNIVGKKEINRDSITNRTVTQIKTLHLGVLVQSSTTPNNPAG